MATPHDLIQGLRLFPWIIQHRASRADNNVQNPDDYADCNTCQIPEEARASVRCGFVPASEREGIALCPPDYPRESPEVCAGYYVDIPAVVEAARAASWRRDGELSMFYDDGITELAKFSIDTIAAEFRSVEQNEHRKSREG